MRKTFAKMDARLPNDGAAEDVDWMMADWERIVPSMVDIVAVDRRPVSPLRVMTMDDDDEDERDEKDERLREAVDEWDDERLQDDDLDDDEKDDGGDGDDGDDEEDNDDGRLMTIVADDCRCWHCCR